ncbi:MAG TPA: Hsp20 family protein [Candidatus Acidoferrum sp.]|jgi:HSP20 family molecular chaperone IbpA
MSAAVSLKTNPRGQTTAAQRVPLNGPLDRIRQIRDAIAHRAYELFQKRGQEAGCDQEDWYGAERELLHAMHYAIFETDAAVTIFAEVPGFHADNLMVSVEPRRITIAGQREPFGQGTKRKVFCAEGCTDQVFHAVALPAEVNPLRTSAALRDGILELVIPKALSAERFLNGLQPNSIVRSKDYKRWTYAYVRLLEGHR